MINKSNDPNYCPYHWWLGHTIERWLTIKNGLEHYCQLGAIMFPRTTLLNNPFGLIIIVFGENDDPLIDNKGCKFFS